MDTDPKAEPESQSCDPRDSEGIQESTTLSLSNQLVKGRYLLIQELGRGGFGITWLASDAQVAGRNVVVKILLDQRAADVWSLRKFRGEMEALARIDHPSVVSVIDFGQLADGRPFMVMQYIPGRPLREMIPREGMPLARVANIIREVGRALSAVHEAGVCHRDVKPENILIQTRGDEEEIKLIDFGIATMLDSAEVLKSTKVSGTSAYMAPEQFHGKSSPASDIYQMGVVAFEMVTGIPPFRAPTPGGFLQQQMAGLKVQPKDLRPDLPEAAQAAILRALSYDSAARQQRARDFGDVVARAILSAELPISDRDAAAQFTPAKRSQPNDGIVPQRRRWWSIAAIFAVLLVATIGTPYWFKIRSPTTGSVAVLPFENRISDPEMDYLSEGITESLIDDLSRIPTLRIRSRGAVLHYSGEHVDPLAAGRELQVTRIVVGSVSRRGDDLRIEAELVDVHSGNRLWGRTYTMRMSSLEDVLAQFSTEIADQLRLTLSGPLKDRLARQYAAGSEAYQEYLKGRYYLNKRSAPNFDSAVRCFNRAVAKNANYAPAYAGLASAYGLIASFGEHLTGTRTAEALEKSRNAAQQANDLDGTLAESYTSLAFVQMQSDYDWKRAEKSFLRSIELNPNWSETREGYALELAATGRFDEALRQIQTAEDLELGSFGLADAHGLILYMARRHDESLALLRAINTPRGSDLPGELTAESVAELLAYNYWAKSMPSDAWAALGLLSKDASPEYRIPLLVTGYARMGQMKKAEEMLDEYVARTSAVRSYNWAAAHLSLGRNAEAIRDLEHAYEDRAYEVMFAAVDPMFDPLRRDSRFHILLAHMKLDSLQ